MPRYKDIDAILKKMPDDLPYKASVKRVLMQAPEADVVPRKEIESIFAEIFNIIRRYEFDALVANESYGIFLVRYFGSEILKLKNKSMEGTDGKQA